MWWLAVEALGALLLFVFIIWWTMFSGRKRGELVDEDADVPTEPSVPAPGADEGEASRERGPR